jgi:branched-chain amino acid transport system substrate-binding protein
MYITTKQRLIFLIFISLTFFVMALIGLLKYLDNIDKPTPSDQVDRPESLIYANKESRLISDGGLEDEIFLQYSRTNPFQQLKNSRQFQQARNYAIKQNDSEYCADPETLIYLNNQKIGNNESYTIAVASPVGGSQGNESNNSAIEMLRGVAQAQDEINSNKINGKFLRVLIASDKVKEQTQDIAQSLVSDKKVLGVVGHDSSNSTIAANEIYSNVKYGEDRIVSISSSSTSMYINPQGNNQYFFRTVPNNKAEATVLADYMLNKLKIVKAAIIWDENDKYSESLKEEFEKIMKAKGAEPPLAFQKRDIKDKNFSQNVFDQKVRAFILTINVDSIKDSFAPIIIDGKAQRFYYLAGDAVYGGESNLIERFQNMVIAVAWHQSDSENSQKSKKFLEKANQLWCQKQNDKNEKVTWRTATAYDATKLFIAALKETSNNFATPTRQSIQQYLQKYKSTSSASLIFNEAVTGDHVSFTKEGDISFIRNNQLTSEPQLVRICQIPGKNYTYKLNKPNWNGDTCS